MSSTERPKGRVRVLSTGHLPSAWLASAAERGVEIRVLPFIRVAPIADTAVDKAIDALAERRADVAFASRNAVEAVIARLGERVPDWTIHCVGEATRKALLARFPEGAIGATADNATSLAAAIIARGGIPELHIFRGDLFRPELPETLAQVGITVHGIEVYRTEETPHRVKERHDGVMFFSPSGARSFFRHNTLQPSTAVFAIGGTTAAEVRRHTLVPVIVPDRPGRARLLRAVLSYFTGTAQHA